VLLLAHRPPDLRGDGVFGRVVGDLDQQVGGILEAAQPYAVATVADVGGVYKSRQI
jgi:hypothetical protein